VHHPTRGDDLTLASFIVADDHESGGQEARKDYLSPGAWTMSVTYPDEQPLVCGPDAQPCNLTINFG
jgi:hypothetical protein